MILALAIVLLTCLAAGFTVQHSLYFALLGRPPALAFGKPDTVASPALHTTATTRTLVAFLLVEVTAANDMLST